MTPYKNHKHTGWRQDLHEVIFEADTPAGKFFDVALVVCIILSVLAVMLDSVGAIRADFGEVLYTLEWAFTILFTIEYVLRLVCVGRPLGYATSFFGVIDLLAILPTYISLLLPSTKYLLVIRVLRVLRIFRILKLAKFVGEAGLLMDAMRASRRKITIFFFVVMTLVVILGSFMYIIEGDEHGFTSIPQGVYWAIVTLTTVGYGDIAPETTPGRILASFVMIMGYAIIAVPTGIVTAEISYAVGKSRVVTRSCHECSVEIHDSDDKFCRQCGAEL
ncbi:MAG: ion transporter [Thermodesulfobacteriota bacterium]